MCALGVVVVGVRGRTGHSSEGDAGPTDPDCWWWRGLNATAFPPSPSPTHGSTRRPSEGVSRFLAEANKAAGVAAAARQAAERKASGLGPQQQQQQPAAAAAPAGPSSRQQQGVSGVLTDSMLPEAAQKHYCMLCGARCLAQRPDTPPAACHVVCCPLPVCRPAAAAPAAAVLLLALTSPGTAAPAARRTFSGATFVGAASAPALAPTRRTSCHRRAR